MQGFEYAAKSLFYECDAWLLPGREIERLSFPFPFPQCDFAAANEFLASQLQDAPHSAGFDACMHGALELRDLCQRWRRLPYYSLNDDEMEQLADFLTSIGVL